MKRLVVVSVFISAFALTFSVCGYGSSKNSAESPSETSVSPTPIVDDTPVIDDIHFVSCENKTLTVDLAFNGEQEKVLNLVGGNVPQYSVAFLRFKKISWAGDRKGWKNRTTVKYNGDEVVRIKGILPVDCGNVVLNGPGIEIWLNLGKTKSKKGCRIVFQKEHARHVICI